MSEAEAPAVWSDTTPASRIPRECCECRKPIPAGERHRHFRGFYPDMGKWLGFRTCMPCTALRDEYMAAVDSYDEGPPFEALHEYLEEAKR